MHPGRFITLEGIEGVGKSTQARGLLESILAAGHDAVATREPGGTPLADRIRSILLDPDGKGPEPDTEALLVFAARAEHLSTLVRPALAAGRWVVCDRFTDATYAYQGGGRGIAEDRIAALERWVHEDLVPDRTILLDAPVDVALARAHGRAKADRFERETTAFFERARSVYLARARAEPARFRVVDAHADPDTVGLRVVESVRDLVDGA